MEEKRRVCGYVDLLIRSVFFISTVSGLENFQDVELYKNMEL